MNEIDCLSRGPDSTEWGLRVCAKGDDVVWSVMLLFFDKEGTSKSPRLSGPCSTEVTHSPSHDFFLWPSPKTYPTDTCSSASPALHLHKKNKLTVMHTPLAHISTFLQGSSKLLPGDNCFVTFFRSRRWRGTVRLLLTPY